MRATPVGQSLSDQSDLDRKVEIGPGTVGSEHFGGVTADGEREAAPVTERQWAAALEPSHRAGQFRVSSGAVR